MFLIEAKETADDTLSSQNSKDLNRKGKKSSKSSIPSKPKKEEDLLSDDSKLFIKKTLVRSGLFNDEINKRSISSRDIDRIVQAFAVEHYQDNQCLFRKDDVPSDKVYIARRGIFRGMDGNVCKVIMREKDMMGELCFFQQSPRLLSVIAGGHQPSAFSLSRRDFKAIVEKGRDLNNIRILDPLTEAQRYLVKDRVTLQNFARGDNILLRGAPIDCFYVLLSGQVQVVGDENPLASLPNLSAAPSATFSTNSSELHIHSAKQGGDEERLFLDPGDYFGEEKFLADASKSSRSFTAANEVTVCCVNKQLFFDEKVFGPARAFIIADIAARKGVDAFRTIRRKRSLVKFSSFQSLQDEGNNSSKTEDTLSQKSQGLGEGAVRKRKTSFRRSTSASSGRDEVEDWTTDIQRDDDVPSTVFCGYDLNSCGLT